MTAIGRLPCCADGAKFIGLRHDEGLFHHDLQTSADFLVLARALVPRWTLHATTFIKRWEASHAEAIHPKFCPFCGTPVPAVRLRAKPPQKICVVLDGGYYCNTCVRRLNQCRCALPERLWEGA